jgi:hypothetical protein
MKLLCRSVKRACIHIAQTNDRLILFDTFNLFDRGGAVGANLIANNESWDSSKAAVNCQWKSYIWYCTSHTIFVDRRLTNRGCTRLHSPIYPYLLHQQL